MLLNPLKAVTVVAVALAIYLGALPQAHAQTNPAVEQIQKFYAGLLDSMKHGKELGPRGRVEVMTPLVDTTFDIATMIKFIVGPSWATMSDADHTALINAFRRMTIANYAANFSTYDGERFDVDPTPQTRGNDEFVATKLVPADGQAVPLIYHMREFGTTWKIIDVLLNGYVSELAMRRSDFASTLASGGAAALVKKIDTLSDNALNAKSQ